MSWSVAHAKEMQKSIIIKEWEFLFWWWKKLFHHLKFSNIIFWLAKPLCCMRLNVFDVFEWICIDDDGSAMHNNGMTITLASLWLSCKDMFSVFMHLTVFYSLCFVFSSQTQHALNWILFIKPMQCIALQSATSMWLYWMNICIEY